MFRVPFLRRPFWKGLGLGINRSKILVLVVDDQIGSRAGSHWLPVPPGSGGTRTCEVGLAAWAWQRDRHGVERGPGAGQGDRAGRRRAGIPRCG
ncbi:hypothetical protein QJS66_15980 [Kocuria rhizophila]|nr:hypothetical protein QJS66_15980 [Kocuria rhizophila]